MLAYRNNPFSLRLFVQAALVLLFPLLTFGQAIRVDQPLQTYGPNVPVSGGPLPQALWIANATVTLCAHPASSIGSCTPLVTYTDSSAGTTCPSNAQLVAQLTITCTSNAGIAGNVGFWYVGGLVDYFVTASYGTFGPFTVEGGSSGGNVNGTGTAGTIPIWTATASQGNGPLSVAGGQIVSADSYNAPILIKPVIGKDPGFLEDSIYFADASSILPVIAYTTSGNFLDLDVFSSGGAVQMFIGDTNDVSKAFNVNGIVLKELNGATRQYVDFFPSHAGVGSPVASGLRFHLGAVGALSGSFFQDITTNAWHFNTGDVGSSTATDVMSVNPVGYTTTKPIVFSVLPACAAGTEGSRVAITDSTVTTFGTTITGGGTNHVSGYCNGSNWVVQ